MGVVDGNATHQPTTQFNKLETEDANTLDVGWRYEGGDFVFAATSVFYSRVNNYAYRERVVEGSGELPVYQYRQNDAKLYGGEVQFSYFFNEQLTFSSFVDYSQVQANIR